MKYYKGLRKRARAAAFLVVCLACMWPLHRVFAESPRSRFVLENRYLSYEVELREGEDARVTIFNKSLNQKHVLSSPVFMVMTENHLASISSSKIHEVRTFEADKGFQTAQIVTSCHRAGLAVSVQYELEDDAFFLKKRLAISRLEAGVTLVTRMDVDVVQVPDAKEVMEFPGLGQPVYYRDIFFGVEYPACTLLHNGRGRIRVGYEYGLPVDLSTTSSHTAVIGVAPHGNAGKSFMKYVDTIRCRPPQPFILWNSWYDLRDFDEKACLESVRLLRAKLCQRYGIRLDSIVLDDGWDDHRSLWRVAKKRFPMGFVRVQKESLKIASGMGFWLSPWGGYGEARKERIAYGRKQGFELLQSPGFRQEGFCLAAPRYNARFRQCAMGFLRDYTTNYLKFDGFPSFCLNPAHGHRVGQYSQVAMTDAFIGILDSLKKKNRGLFINITSGTWHSPWWLAHADSVWMQGADFGHDGWGSVRQRSITYKDWRMYIAFREKKAQFPLNALMTVGIVKGRFDTGCYRAPEKHETQKDWQDHVMMNLGMGTMHLELYISPSIMSDKELAFLAEKIKWWLDNAGVLAHTKMILGNPHLGEVYAYVHLPEEDGAARKGFIFIRNPSLEKKKASVLLDDSIELPRKVRRLRVKRIYPAGASPTRELARGTELSLELEPLETRVLETQWESK